MKITVVTPVYNSEKFLAETIESVIYQKGDFFIEYIIVDNCSTDGTKEIIEEVRSLLNKQHVLLGCKGIELIFISEHDKGMYDAINKGFEKATGDIYAWINADDIYLPGALATIVKVFNSYEDVHWLKGITSYITEETTIWKSGCCLLYTQSWIKAGIYGRDHYFIQQDSVFWRAWLWKQSGGVDKSFKLAGDYYLWVKFAELAPLVTVRAWVSCFRTVKGQLSADVDAYRQEAEKFSPCKKDISMQFRLFYRIEKILPSFLKKPFFRVIFGQLEFSLILTDSDGTLHRVTDKYYDVVRLL